MYILLFGLILFFAIHLLPASVSLRQQAVQRLGEYGYKGVLGLIALLGLALVVYGMSEREYVVTAEWIGEGQKKFAPQALIG